MVQPVEKQPTIEQNSTFSAKTKDGQNVEFEANLKIYITTTGDVRITAPGADVKDTEPQVSFPTHDFKLEESHKHEEHETEGLIKSPPDNTGEVTDTIPSGEPITETPLPPGTKPEAQRVDEKPKVTVVPKADSTIRLTEDKELAKAFRKAPDGCTITQFIPDPCRAVDDLQRSFKSLISNVFGSTEKASRQINEGGNTEDADIINNEEKFEV